jgi:pyruvate dehydrogenase E2 component (dihydrolipoamide acetyltransferase)
MAHATSKDPNVFLLPDLGEGLAEAELLKWRVEIGQRVNELDVLAEMETDKAVVEVTSPRAGRIKALHGNPGDIIKVGTPLVEYEAEGASSGGDNGVRTEPKAGHASEIAPAPKVSDEPREDAGTVVGMVQSGAPKALATPAVRRLARDLGVDIDSIRGTGIGGRVLERDVREAAMGKTVRERSDSVAATTERTSAHPTAAPARPRPVASVSAPQSSARPAPTYSGDEVTRVPFRGVRRTIASRLRESVDQAVHFTVMDEAEVSTLDALRRKMAAASGEKVSFLPFVASAVCRVLSMAKYRCLNATVDERPGDESYAPTIVQHRSVHLGIATDTDNGLMVPVVRDADRLGVLEMSRAIAAAAEGARTRTASREQLMGSTFTISNVGSHAGRFATPVINYPEVAIIAVGRAREGVVVSGGAFRVGLLLPLSLACDHRVVDGATCALALAEIVSLLGRPETLLGPARE